MENTCPNCGHLLTTIHAPGKKSRCVCLLCDYTIKSPVEADYSFVEMTVTRSHCNECKGKCKGHKTEMPRGQGVTMPLMAENKYLKAENERLNNEWNACLIKLEEETLTKIELLEELQKARDELKKVREKLLNV